PSVNRAAGLAVAAAANICARRGSSSASTASALSRNGARGCAARQPRSPPTTASICFAHRAASASPSGLPIAPPRPHLTGYLTHHRVGHLLTPRSLGYPCSG